MAGIRACDCSLGQRGSHQIGAVFGHLHGPCLSPDGVSHGLAIVVATAVANGITLFLAAAIRRCRDHAILTMAAVCAVLGMFTCYHRHYDNVMLLPAVLLAVSNAAETRKQADIAAALVFAATLATPLPMRFLNTVPMVQLGIAGIWLVGGLRPVAFAVIHSRRRTDIT